MALAWFDAAAAQEFGSSLALFFVEKMPLNDIQKLDDKLFERKSKKTLAAMSTQIVEFRKRNKLNLYKRAQLSNKFKWTLKDQGYADAYVNELTLWLVKQL